MTYTQKAEIISEISMLLDKLIEVEHPVCNEAVKTTEIKNEMLTIKECVAEFKGLTEYALRKLINQKSVHCVRIGCGKGSKILVSKKALSDYLNGDT